MLVVDDQEEMRLLVREALEPFGWTIVEARNSDEALTFVGDLKDPLHLLVMDLMLEGDEDGLSLARSILNLRPGVPVLFMSGYTDLEARLEGAPDLPTDFIGKPISVTELARKARRLMVSSRSG